MKTKKKADIVAKLAARPKKYNVMIGYDPIMGTEVKLAVENDGKKKNIRFFTDTYLYAKDFTKEEAEHVRELVRNLKFEFKNKETGNQKVYKVRYVSVTLAPDLAFGHLNRINKKKNKGKVHSTGSKSTNYEKKLSKRVKKATLAIIKADNKKPVTAAKKAPKRVKMKPIQTKINFKYAGYKKAA